MLVQVQATVEEYLETVADFKDVRKSHFTVTQPVVGFVILIFFPSPPPFFFSYPPPPFSINLSDYCDTVKNERTC